MSVLNLPPSSSLSSRKFVDLAVVNDMRFLSGSAHWLGALFEIENRESSVTDRPATGLDCLSIVRSAVGDAGEHLLDRLDSVIRFDSDDCTHIQGFSLFFIDWGKRTARRAFSDAIRSRSSRGMGRLCSSTTRIAPSIGRVRQAMAFSNSSRHSQR